MKEVKMNLKDKCVVCGSEESGGWIEMCGETKCIKCFKKEMVEARQSGYDPQKEFKKAARVLNKMTKEVK